MMILCQLSFIAYVVYIVIKVIPALKTILTCCREPPPDQPPEPMYTYRLLNGTPIQFYRHHGIPDNQHFWLLFGILVLVCVLVVLGMQYLDRYRYRRREEIEEIVNREGEAWRAGRNADPVVVVEHDEESL